MGCVRDPVGSVIGQCVDGTSSSKVTVLQHFLPEINQSIKCGKGALVVVLDDAGNGYPVADDVMLEPGTAFVVRKPNRSWFRQWVYTPENLRTEEGAD